MRQYHRIARGLTQPWMLWGCVAGEAALASFAIPACLFMVLRVWWVLLLLPVSLVASYLVTAKDLYMFAVLWEHFSMKTNPISLRSREGVKTYVSR